ncbi:MAG: glycoside hydrolase, partial [Actinobacteria bacterium]|nr:glycoside hydrolase [Actinomycetota bacterium]
MRSRLGAALIAAMALAALATVPAQARSPMITASSQATPADLAVRAYGSPGVVVDPDDPRHVFAAGVEFRTGRCAFQRSADGGATWREIERAPSVPGYPLCTHNLGQLPVGFLAMGRNKTLYWAFVASSIEDQPNLSVFLARSDDLGDTWTTTPVRDARGKRVPAPERNTLMDLAVDTRRDSGDVVYVSWMGSPRLVTPPQAPQAMVAASFDGGRTFAQPVDAADSFFSQSANLPEGVPMERRTAKQIGGLQPNLAIDGRGNVYVVWLELVVGDPFHSPVRWRRMYVSRSSDQGRTFTEHTLVRTMTTDGVGLIGPMLEWSPRGGPEGSLHLVYESRISPAQGDRDVQYQRSVDGNRSWSDVKVINDDDPRQLLGQFLPNVAVAPSGRVDIAWWDMRDGAVAYANDVYYSYTEDAGATWSPNLRVTDRSIDRKLGIWTNNSDTRQPPGLGSADELAVVVWDDTRNADAVDGAQDLRAAAVQFEDLGTGGSQRLLAYGLAGLAGAGTVGLALLVVGVVG